MTLFDVPQAPQTLLQYSRRLPEEIGRRFVVGGSFEAPSLVYCEGGWRRSSRRRTCPASGVRPGRSGSRSLQVQQGLGATSMILRSFSHCPGRMQAPRARKIPSIRWVRVVLPVDQQVGRVGDERARVHLVAVMHRLDHPFSGVRVLQPEQALPDLAAEGGVLLGDDALRLTALQVDEDVPVHAGGVRAVRDQSTGALELRLTTMLRIPGMRPRRYPRVAVGRIAFAASGPACRAGAGALRGRALPRDEEALPLQPLVR